MSDKFTHLAAPGVQQLQPYMPGMPVEELERELGIRDSIKLASNENPLGPSPLALEAVHRRLEGIHYYPDGSAYQLGEKLAQAHEMQVENFTFGNGSNDVLELVARAFLAPGHSAVYSQFTFAVYPIVVQAIGAGARVAEAFPADHAEMPLGHDPKAILAAIDDTTRVVFIANPNNPTGTWIAPDDVADLLSRIPERVIVVLDLAYLEYMPDKLQPDSRELLRRHPNLVITRTFSKIHALAGLRIGYAMSHPDIADLMNRVRQPFNTNMLAQAAALAALDDDAHVARSIEMNDTGRRYYTSALEDMGLQVLPTMGNFVTVDWGCEARSAYEGLLRQGIIVRPVANYSMPNHLRITIGTAEQNERCIDALARVLATL